jgi:hypothetical protein
MGPFAPSRRTLLFGGAAIALVGCQRPTVTPTATPSPFVGPDLASRLVGQDVRVRMRVECAEFGARGQPTYLKPSCYFDGYYFRLSIPFEKRELFTRAVSGAPEVQLVDRVVDARGVVRTNGQWSEIVLDATDQLKIATGWRPPPVPTKVPGL